MKDLRKRIGRKKEKQLKIHVADPTKQNIIFGTKAQPFRLCNSVLLKCRGQTNVYTFAYQSKAATPSHLSKLSIRMTNFFGIQGTHKDLYCFFTTL
jgi:hypothetical protein